MKNYICNLMIPGAAKSGTSSRHDLLGQHRDIDMSKPKEPQHFSFDDLYEGGAEAHNGPFRSDGTYRYHGESSQCYMFHPVAMRRIKQHLPSPKIILRLRDPVAQLWSQYQWNYRRAVERAPLCRRLPSVETTPDTISIPRYECARKMAGIWFSPCTVTGFPSGARSSVKRTSWC